MTKMLIERTLLKLFWIFPVNKRKVFFSSYEGASISCNPKYIFQELEKRWGNRLKYVWEYNNIQNSGHENHNIIFAKHNSIKYIYHILTSRIVVSNTGITASLPIRKSQFSINTWHGAGCYKKVGKDYEETKNKKYKKYRYYAEKNVNYYLSGCKAWTEVFSKAVYSDKQKFLPNGSPRIDYLFASSEDEKERIKQKICIKERIVLYAPTYRGDRDNPQKAICPIDVNKILNALSEKFGGEWLFCYRCHYATASTFARIKNAKDLSKYEDMQELLLVADVLISDYSSSIWDFSFTNKPCFLYCYDLDLYSEERDFYLPIRDWHFPISTNMDELTLTIQEFDHSKYIDDMKKHHMELGNYENGNATSNIVEIINEWL